MWYAKLFEFLKHWPFVWFTTTNESDADHHGNDELENYDNRDDNDDGGNGYQYKLKWKVDYKFMITREECYYLSSSATEDGRMTFEWIYKRDDNEDNEDKRLWTGWGKNNQKLTCCTSSSYQHNAAGTLSR